MKQKCPQTPVNQILMTLEEPSSKYWRYVKVVAKKGPNPLFLGPKMSENVKNLLYLSENDLKLLQTIYKLVVIKYLDNLLPISCNNIKIITRKEPNIPIDMKKSVATRQDITIDIIPQDGP